MSATEDRKTALHAAMRRIVEPVAEQYREIEAELQELGERRTELLEARREALSILRHVDPDNPTWAPRPKAKAKRSSNTRVSEEVVTSVEEWLRSHAGDNGLADGFYSAELLRREDFDLEIGKDALSHAVTVLAERGVLRLDRLGGPRGRAKIYKLTT
jgi:DNA-binding transcriptional ArsR family regulator